MIGFKNLEELQSSYKYALGNENIKFDESYLSDEDIGEDLTQMTAVQKLLKPLEAVEEDVEEASETETPVSELI